MAYTVEQLCTKEGLRHTFGYLLPVAHGTTTICYGEIANKLAGDLGIAGKIFSIHVGSVVGTLMERILKIEKDAPLINVLVVRQGTDQPSDGADPFLRARFHLPNNLPIRPDHRHKLVDQAAQAVYAFQRWPSLYKRLFTTDPPPSDPVSLIEGDEVDGMPPASVKSGKARGGPSESEEHKKLKKYVLQNPKLVGAPNRPDYAEPEKMLLSGDEVDVYFTQGDLFHLVEVKSIRSTEPDFLRGVYQCIKYRAVFQAQCMSIMPTLRIVVTLVVEAEPPSHIRKLAKLHKVRLVVAAVNH